MVTPSRPQQLLEKTWAAYIEAGENAAEAARNLGNKPPETVRSILKECREKGMHLSEGARNSMELSGLQGIEVRGGHRRVYDEAGKQIDTVRWSAPAITSAIRPKLRPG